MYYQPRFSAGPETTPPSAAAGGPRHNPIDDSPTPRQSRSPVTPPHLVRSYSPAASAPAPSPHPCWCCGAGRAQAGFPSCPRLFFPPQVSSASSAINGHLPCSPSAITGGGGGGGHRPIFGSRGATTVHHPITTRNGVSTLSLCEGCYAARGASSSYANSSSSGTARCSPACRAHTAAYAALLTSLADKAIRASQQFASGGTAGEAPAVVVVAVTPDTPLERATPQLQRKVLGVLVQRLEAVTEQGLHQATSGGGGGAMSQSERNLFLHELFALERAAAVAIDGQEAAAVAAAVSTPYAQSKTPDGGGRGPRTPMAMPDFSSRATPGQSSPAAQPQPQPQPQQQRPQQAKRAAAVAAPQFGGRGVLAGMIENAMWRAASPDGSTSRRDDGRTSTGARRRGDPDRPPRQPLHQQPRQHAEDDRNGKDNDNDDDDVLLSYFSRRTRDPNRQRSASRNTTAATGTAEAANGSLVVAPATGPPPDSWQLAELETALEAEEDRCRAAEVQLLAAHRRIAALEGVTNDVGERLLTHQLSFSPAFHLDRLNDFFGTVVTFSGLFCLRKSMLFAEAIAGLTREATRRQMRQSGGGGGRQWQLGGEEPSVLVESEIYDQ